MRPIGARVSATGIEEAGVESGLVAQEEQALAVGIEAPDGIDARREAEAGKGAVGRAVRGELREDAAGLVEGEEHAPED